jgi:hypothetical protein
MSEPGRRGWRSSRFVTRLLDEEHLWSLLALVAIVAIAGTEFGVRTYDYGEGRVLTYEKRVWTPCDMFGEAEVAIRRWDGRTRTIACPADRPSSLAI